VIDGEIVAWRDGAPQPFAALQTRIGRKTLTPSCSPRRRSRCSPTTCSSRTASTCATRRRRSARAARGAASPPSRPRLVLSPRVERASWDATAALREESRDRGVEGFMLKRRDARYGVGRTKATARGGSGRSTR
jgi:DNA ligase-1